MEKRIFVILNTVTLAVAIVIFNITGFNGTSGMTIQQLSHHSLIKPADFIYSVWWIIFPLLVAFVGYQWLLLKKDVNRNILENVDVYFILSNLALTGWMILWQKGYAVYSVAAMFVVLLMLIILIIRLRMETWDAPLRILLFVWWPLAVFFGWMIVASITGTAAFLDDLDIGIFRDYQVFWAYGLILFALGIFIFIVFKRNLRESALIGVWGGLPGLEPDREPAKRELPGLPWHRLLFYCQRFYGMDTGTGKLRP